MNKYHVGQLLVLSLLIATQSSFAKGAKNRTTIEQANRGKSITSRLKLLQNKRLRPGKVQKNLLPYYSAQYLKSKYTAGWAVDPDNSKSSIKLLESWKHFKKNSDVVVAVIDTGIQRNHPFLKDNIYTFGNKTGKASAEDYGMDVSLSQKNTRPDDKHGHGTHVAGTIKSVFPEVKILPVKYFDPKASGKETVNATVRALKYAVDMNVDIINYSGGGPSPSLEEKEVLKQAEAKGILIVAAAGNASNNIDLRKNAYYPASYGFSNIISVGALNKNDKLIKSSNWGKYSVDIAAPGKMIRSSYPRNGFGKLSGTSQATAFVTGVVALIKSNYPQMSYQQLKNIIISSSKALPNLKGKVLGAGKLDAEQALITARKVNDSQISAGRSVAASQAKPQFKRAN